MSGNIYIKHISFQKFDLIFKRSTSDRKKAAGSKLSNQRLVDHLYYKCQNPSILFCKMSGVPPMPWD